jgi:hypothetical protein
MPGTALSEQLRTAVMMSQKQQLHHQELTATFNSKIIQEWEKMVESWDNDPRAPNPYMEPIISKSLSLSGTLQR